MPTPTHRFDRRSLLYALLAASALLPIAFPRVAVAKPGDTKHFVILHTNDTHGHLLPFSYPESYTAGSGAAGADIARMPFRHDIGGIARRATLVNQIRKSENNVYLFDGGDVMDGTSFSVEFFAQADYAAMNAIGYDYAVTGNHDYNMTPAQFTALQASAKFPRIVANVTDPATGKTILPPYVIANWNGLKVAIFGLVTYDVHTYPVIKKAPYTVTDPIETASKLVPELRKQADLVIAVTHIGLDVDTELARKVPGIDIIVGGHTHTRLPVGAYQITDSPGAGDPRGTVILQDHQWGGELGHLDVTVTEGGDGRWQVTQYGEHLIPITSDIKEDPKVAAIVASYWDKIKDKYGVTLANATADIVEPANYYLVADAMKSYTKAQFDLENEGGVRTGWPAGTIRFEDVAELDPFKDYATTYSITGAELKKVLAEQRPMPSKGLVYAVKKRADKGWDFVSGSLDGAPIDDNTVYHGATTDYFAGVIKDHITDVVKSDVIRRDVIVGYLKANSTLTPDTQTRADFGGVDPFAE